MVLSLLVGGLVVAFLGWQALQSASYIVHILALVGGLASAISTFMALERKRYLSDIGLIEDKDLELVAYMFLVLPVFFLVWKFLEAVIVTSSLTLAILAVLAVASIPYIGLTGLASIIGSLLDAFLTLMDVFGGEN